MQATHRVELDLITLITCRERTAHIFPLLQSVELISMGKTYTNGCTDTFTTTRLTVENQHQTVPEGQHKGDSGMWQVAVYRVALILLELAP